MSRDKLRRRGADYLNLTSEAEFNIQPSMNQVIPKWYLH
jgi:hypothetical protein